MTESADGYFNEFWEKIIATNHQQLLIKLIKNGNIFFVRATVNIDLRSVELLLKPLAQFTDILDMLYPYNCYISLYCH